MFLPLSGSGSISVGFLLLPDFPLMSYAAAVEPLRAANKLAGRQLYRWWHASPDGEVVQASLGLEILPRVRLDDRPLDADRIFVVAGGDPAAFKDRHVFAWLRRTARRGIALGGISGGPYVLGRAGLLDGRRCTLHWEHIPAFQETFPLADVKRSLFEIDGDRITCSGGIAALDMTLELLTTDFGKPIATEVSDWFLHNQMREGPSPQRMTFARRFNLHDHRLSRVLEAIDRHIDNPLTRGDLAAIANVSERQLERLFRNGLNMTMHDYYLRVRLDQAHRLRRDTAMTSDEIAQASGFLSASALGRVKRRFDRRSQAGSSIR